MTERTAEHARFAPSGADIYGPDGCPAAVQMQERVPPQEDTDESREGTAAHWLLAEVLQGREVADGTLAPNGVPINDEMRGNIRELVEDVRDTMASQRGDWSIRIEMKIAAPGLVHPDFWGTPDIFLINWTTKRLYIWDFKYGHGFVDVYRNWQLIGYFACITETFQIPDVVDWTVCLTIAQPRCFVRDELGSTLREYYTPGAGLSVAVGELAAAVEAANGAEPIARTGDHCRYCRAITICQANQRAGGAACDVTTASVATEQTPESIGAEMTALRRAAKRATDRLTALEAMALNMIDNGKSVPFHKVDFSRPRLLFDKTKIADAVPVLQMFGVPVLPGVALPTPTELIKQGIDETVITPYAIRAPGAKKLGAISERSAEKLLGRRPSKGK